ncbi:hypothetical protein FBULB1_3947 [Fusarium bulbicola]|nr:hypothetical protein FBULB1_3947 [Fusarium bulbicola]
MFLELSVRHRWRLSNSEGDESSTPGLHKRFTKRLSHFWRRKRDRFDTKVAAKTKQAGDAPSNNGIDDPKSIGQRMPYKALSLLFKSGYPVPDILARARLQCQQNGDHYRPAAGGPSSHKRPPGSPGKSGSNSKKPRKENKQPADKAQNGTNGDGGEGGGGDDAPSDTDSDDDEDDEGDSSRDGPRFPLPTNSPDRKTFPCPFHKYDAARYCKCKGHHITSISYVIQHIGRRHLLKEVRMDVQETAHSTDDDTTQAERTTDPAKIVFYCPRCRNEFHGRKADVRNERHTGCEPKSIAQTGVLIPAEFRKLKEDVTATSGDDQKWKKIWTTLYPEETTPTQHNEAEPIATIAVDAQPHNDIQHDPLPGAVNEPYHPAPPGQFDPQGANFLQNPQDYLSNDLFAGMFNNSWGTANGDVRHATSHIPNPAPPNLQMIRPVSDITQWSMLPTQNPPFPNPDCFITCRVCGNASHMARDCPNRHHDNFYGPQ